MEHDYRVLLLHLRGRMLVVHGVVGWEGMAMRAQRSPQDGMTDPRCDLAAHSDFPCAGELTEITEQRRGNQRGIVFKLVCESHRRRMLQDIQDEWEKERE